MSKHYLLPCPNCSHNLPVTISQAGRTINCSQCQTAVNVPNMRELKKLGSPGGSAEANTVANASARRLGRVLFGSGLATAVLFGVIGWSIHRYSSRQVEGTEVDTNKAVAFSASTVDSASNAELYRTWQSSIADHELEEWREAGWNRINRRGRTLQVVSKILFGVAAFGVLLMITAIFMSARR